VLGYLIMLAITGLIVGALARLALPGRDPMSLLQTMLVGIAGSFAAGLLFYAITDERNGIGILPAVLFSTGIVYLIRRSRGGTLTRSAPRDRVGGGSPLAR
jgi:uncharacterized membrane protein YeaQ/YmgE (transglycosylase-associated protein family)